MVCLQVFVLQVFLETRIWPYPGFSNQDAMFTSYVQQITRIQKNPGHNLDTSAHVNALCRCSGIWTLESRIQGHD